jgi:hypothetical protein
MAAAPDVLFLFCQPSGRPPLCILPLILFQLFIHAPPIYALVRVGANACLECSSQNGIQREIGTTKHHLPHVIQTVPTQLEELAATVLVWKRLDDVTPDYVEAAQLVE